jgi:adenylate cyclase
LERRLAAIVVADVVGYSRLMGEDEAGTLTRLKICRRDVIEPAIAKFHGRIIKLMGDGALVEFASVVDAVECAAAIQRGVISTGSEPADPRRIQLRIGINLGDVIVEGDDLYGDGVNVAARLEAMAEPGGICVSGTAFDHAIHKASVGFESLGELRLKNIPDPVRAYRVVFDPSATRRPAAKRRVNSRSLIIAGFAGLLLVAIAAFILFRSAPETAKRPSLAVLPFANMSPGESDNYFAEGITEDLTTELAKLSAVDVIARNSAFKYKDQQVAPKDVARDLGVRYIVEGSVRRTGDGIRINAELVDAATGNLLWADKYDRKAADVFVIQDEVVGAIIAALGIKPTVAETEVLARLPTANLEAYDNYLRGEQAARGGFRPRLRQALEFFAKAETLDPNFADAFAADARTSVFIWRNTYDDVLLTPVAKKRAYEMASRALSLNPRASEPYTALAMLQAVDGQFEQALASAKRSVALGPNSVDAQIALGFVLSTAGQHKEAEAAIVTAQRLDPNLTAADRQVTGQVFLLGGNTAEAIKTLERARADAPRLDDIQLLLAAAYAEAGRMDEAREAADSFLGANRFASIAYQQLNFSYLRIDADRARLLSLFSKAGFPDWPYDFHGDERNRLNGPEISRLTMGHTLRGKVHSGSPAIMQIGKDGNWVFRSTTLLMTGTAFVSDNKLCQLSESLVALGRSDCGPVYRLNAGESEAAYVYVNATNVFYFSPVD